MFCDEGRDFSRDLQRIATKVALTPNWIRCITDHSNATNDAFLTYEFYPGEE